MTFHAVLVSKKTLKLKFMIEEVLMDNPMKKLNSIELIKKVFEKYPVYHDERCKVYKDKNKTFTEDRIVSNNANRVANSKMITSLFKMNEHIFYDDFSELFWYDADKVRNGNNNVPLITEHKLCSITIPYFKWKLKLSCLVME